VRDGDRAGDAEGPEQVSIWVEIPHARNGPFGMPNGSAFTASGLVLAAPRARTLTPHAAYDWAMPSARDGRAVPSAPGGAASDGVLPFVTRLTSGMTNQWPLHTFLELGALDGAVPSARLHARHVLWEWGLGGFRDTIELVVSELVTNGVQASRSMAEASIRLWLFSDRAQVVVLVWDASPQPPVRMDISDDAENGRGLLLVEALSAQWGWDFPAEDGTPAADRNGKFVWAVVLLPAVWGGRGGKSPRPAFVAAGSLRSRRSRVASWLPTSRSAEADDGEKTCGGSSTT
jgi:anti-sigma regulatory factor (Ser/Thr protein kinase)